VGRKLLWASLVLAPITLGLRFFTGVGDTALFLVSAAALIPLAWLIGEATEQAGEHTGPGIGGFLNASFGNAPELIIALFAVSESLPNVVRASLMGSVVSNILLVLGAALIFGGDHGSGKPLDRFSMLLQLGLVLVATLLFFVPSVPGWHGDPERHSLALATIPVAVVLLLLYVGATVVGLRRHKRLHEESGEEASEGGWSLPVALAALGAATALTALVSETLVHSLHAFAEAAGLSEFFIAAVIVAIVGNAAEHGGAIVIAHAGKMKLASEIAISSSAQVGLLVTPAVVLLSLLFTHHLPLTFRWEEIAAMAGAVFVTIVAVRDGLSRKREGTFLLLAYAGVIAGFLVAGDR
jgi:Ca2+:H+ antiporter